MKEFKILEADSVLQNKGYKYNVQIYINGVYSGVGRFCKDMQEVNKYIKANN